MRRNPPGPPPRPAELRARRNRQETTKLTPRGDTAPVALKPPPGLLPSTRKAWKAFWASPVAQAIDVNADGPLLVRWATFTDEFERTMTTLRKARVVQRPSGVIAMNPLMAYAQFLAAEISHCEAQLGCTPAARARLGLVLGQARLTVAELNRNLTGDQDRESKPWAPSLEGKWSAV